MHMFEYYEMLIREQYSKDASIEAKRKTLGKFGKNTSLATGVQQMVWLTGGIETLPTDNDITHIASDDNADDQPIRVEGHTVDGNGDFTFVVQTVTLDGFTKTPLSTPLARITRAENMGSTDLAGTVTIAEDVTFTDGVPASGIHMTLTGEDNQSLKGATTISKNDFWVITSIQYSVLRQASANVDFKLQVRNKGGVFKTKHSSSVSNGSGSFEKHFEFAPIIVPPNSDVRVLATSNANSTVVDVHIDGVLASVIR